MRTYVRERRVVSLLGSLVRLVAPFAALVLGWQVVVMTGRFPAALLPGVGAVGHSLLSLAADGSLVSATGITLLRVLEGFAVGSVVGLIVGVGVGRSKFLGQLVMPLFSAVLPIPAVAWIPLLILWFGLGERAILVLAVLTVTVPVAINVWGGVRSVPEVFVRAARSMGAGPIRTLYSIVLPGALPAILVGLRLGLASSWRAVVAGEMLAAAANGLGVLELDASQYIQTGTVLAALVVVAVVSVIIEKVLFQTVARVTIERWGMS